MPKFSIYLFTYFIFFILFFMIIFYGFTLNNANTQKKRNDHDTVLDSDFISNLYYIIGTSKISSAF